MVLVLVLVTFYNDNTFVVITSMPVPMPATQVVVKGIVLAVGDVGNDSAADVSFFVGFSAPI